MQEEKIYEVLLNNCNKNSETLFKPGVTDNRIKIKSPHCTAMIHTKISVCGYLI